jgi:hypothetical protein
LNTTLKVVVAASVLINAVLVGYLVLNRRPATAIASGRSDVGPAQVAAPRPEAHPAAASIWSEYCANPACDYSYSPGDCPNGSPRFETYKIILVDLGVRNLIQQEVKKRGEPLPNDWSEQSKLLQNARWRELIARFDMNNQVAFVKRNMEKLGQR